MSDVNTSSRRAKARGTRSAIVGAAHLEFLERGYHGATMASIAKRAGVAVQTIYFVFHTKAELASEVIDAAVLGPEQPEAPEDSSWWAAMSDAPNGTAALELFIRGAAPLLSRAAGISEVVRAAALTDDELRVVHETHNRRQTEGYRRVVELASATSGLRQGLTVHTATDLLLLYCGDATWVQLRDDRGWDEDQITDWLVHEVPRALFTNPA